MLLVLTIFFLVVYAGLILYYWKGWNVAPVYTAAAANQPRAFLSVIIPARNEEQHITQLLDALQQQSFPASAFEMIVVDDFSTDRTAERVTEYALPNLRLLQPSVTEGASSKKKAIEAGIAAAQGELIITTDADCIPPPAWLETLHDFYQAHQANFIAAPVKFHHDQSLLQLFQSVDFMVLQGITAASVSTGFHSMCNGANLAYQKKAFTDVNGFEGIDHVATGDDMLLMHKISRKDPSRVFYLKAKEAIVTTAPMQSWKQFYMQRKRWASKSLVYDDKRIIAVLFFVYCFNLLGCALVIAALLAPFYWWHAGLYLVAKTLIEMPFFRSVARFYGE